MKLAALLMPESDGGDDVDLRRHARRVKAARIREALKGEDDDALADALWPDDADDAEED